MKRAYRLTMMAAILCGGSLFCFTGCDQQEPPETIAVVASADLAGGNNGTLSLINTDLPHDDHTVIEGVKKPTHVIISPDGGAAYVCGSSEAVIAVVDIATRSVTKYDVNGNTIWDMALTKDGKRLVVGTNRGLLNYGRIIVYDTADMRVLNDFIAYENEMLPTSVYGCKLAVHPTSGYLYVISKDIFSTNIYVRAFSPEGLLVGQRIKIASQSWFGGDFDDYDIGISPDGKLLLAVSSDVFPFAIDDLTFEPHSLYGNMGLGVDNSPALKGKSTLLFTDNGKYMYVNSTGIRYFDLINDGGGSLLLSRKKIMAEEEAPVLYDIIDFIEDMVPILSTYFAGETYQKIVDMFMGENLFGVAASTVQGNTCYMLLAPVVDAATVTESGAYLLLISSYDPILGMNILSDVRLLTEYPNGISVNGKKNTLTISYSRTGLKQLEIVKKSPLGGWTFSGSEIIDLENNPRVSGIATCQP